MIMIQDRGTDFLTRGGPLYRENKREDISVIGSELKVSVCASFERLKVICGQKGGRKMFVN